MRPKPRPRASAPVTRLALRALLPALAALAALGWAGVPAGAQLRPYDPPDWSIFDSGVAVVGHAGVGVLTGQRASLAGTEGRLVEAGLYHVFIRTGRVAIEAGGTALRLFADQERFAEPYGGALDQPSGSRSDAGDHRIATIVRLTPDGSHALATLRFGTRLPTTDNRVGLERDATDFFALLGGRLDRGAVRASGELGVGIHGTREPEYEQSDVLAFTAGLEHRGSVLRPSLWIVGHADGLAGRAIRGNEELAEIRVQLRTTGRTWVQATALRGLTRFSPEFGAILTAGITR